SAQVASGNSMASASAILRALSARAFFGFSFISRCCSTGSTRSHAGLETSHGAALGAVGFFVELPGFWPLFANGSCSLIPDSVFRTHHVLLPHPQPLVHIILITGDNLVGRLALKALRADGTRAVVLVKEPPLGPLIGEHADFGVEALDRLHDV